MIEALLPSPVVTCWAAEDLLGPPHFAAELELITRAVEKRRREFLTGRSCARRALAGLGIEPAPILRGARGEPCWPPGVVGTITHCEGYRAAAVARREQVRSVGIDAEPHQPLPDGVLEQVAFGPELRMVQDPRTPIHLDRVLFCVKEAVYKTWFPLAQRWLGFEDVEVSLDLAAGRFDARLLVPGPQIDGEPLRRISGRWSIAGGHLAAAAIVLPGH